MNELLFSAASLWEIVSKRGLGRSGFQEDARVLRRGLLDNGYLEIFCLGVKPWKLQLPETWQA
ncbi:MAG: hypothetical protein PHO08_18485 [Methylococcales bacterium]|nr:hypothetical protein [Methylococcales bacterium]